MSLSRDEKVTLNLLREDIALVKNQFRLLNDRLTVAEDRATAQERRLQELKEDNARLASLVRTIRH